MPFFSRSSSAALTLLALSFLAASPADVHAQSTTVLFLPGFDQQPIQASAIASDATATTYAISNPPGTDSDDAGIPGTVTIVSGPTTFAMSFGVADEETDSVQCVLDSVSATCTATVAGSSAISPGVSTATADITSNQVTVTLVSALAGTTSTGSAVPSVPTSSASSGAAGSSAPSRSGASSPAASSTGTAAPKSAANGLYEASKIASLFALGVASVLAVGL